MQGVARVLDGDTIEVGGVRVRLEGLHCPEGNDPGGSAATSAMRGLTGGQHVTCPRYDPAGRYLPAQREAGPWRGSMPGYC